MIAVHPATKWRHVPATKWRNNVATKWRHDVAMGVSPWIANPHHTISPEGTTGNPTHPTHVAPSGLRDRFDIRIHGFAPVATTCRPFGTNVLTPGRTACADGFVVDTDRVYDLVVRAGQTKKFTGNKLVTASSVPKIKGASVKLAVD